jgi:hypothetical protein
MWILEDYLSSGHEKAAEVDSWEQGEAEEVFCRWLVVVVWSSSFQRLADSTPQFELTAM